MLKQTSFMFLLLFFWGTTTNAQKETTGFLSENGHFQISYKSQLDPIAINRIHSWTLHISTAGGEPVSNAVVTIVGGMPDHNHGLATEPAIVAAGDGDYLLQGLRFHMMGYWVLEFTIDDGKVSDKVVIPLEL